MAKMIYLTNVSYLVLVLMLNCFFYRRVASAYCCQSKSKTLSSFDRNTWLSEVGTLDELHLRWMKKTILTNFRLQHVPEEAPRWRKTRSVAVLLEQTQRLQDEDDAEDDKKSRLYSLKVVGLLQSNRSVGHGKKRYHHKHRNGHKGCAAHFEFRAKPAATGSTYDNYKTILDRAELQLPIDGVFILHTNYSTTLDRVPDVDQTRFGDSSSVQGRNNRIVDVTSVLRSFWSSFEMGSKVSLTWRSRQACRLYRGDGGLSSNLHTRFQPILRLELRETGRSSSLGDRSLRKRQIDVNSPRNRRRQNIIIDCEQQWDSAFLANISTEIYDSLMPCCRRKVKVDFTELGWDQWVVAPQTFDSYYCIGRCTYFGGFASEDTEGASFYTELMNFQRRARSLGLAPCCSPVKFSPLTITVLTGDNEEMTQTLEDVVVKQCGCM